MPFNILQVILIAAVSITLVVLAFPSIMGTVSESMDMVELNFIKSQFDACNDRILETARTGVDNRCFFNIDRGELRGSSVAIVYRLEGGSNLCDPHKLVEIDERRHIWQMCNETGSERVFEMRWMFPEEIEIAGSNIGGSMMWGETNTGDIEFDPDVDFRTVSVYVNFEYKPEESGNIVDMERVSFTEDDVTLKITLH